MYICLPIADLVELEKMSRVYVRILLPVLKNFQVEVMCGVTGVHPEGDLPIDQYFIVLERSPGIS